MNAAKKQSTDDTTICPWCSATIPAEAARCPSCGAALRDGADGDVLGVTQVDLAATSRLARLKPPGRIAMLLGAERTTDDPELSGRIEPPSDEVRKEMLRLELAAIDAEIEAKNAQLEAERALALENGAPDAPEEPPSSEPG
ncbi:MAG TPA: hypothetical protein VFP56_05025 [Candidatus Limnocylindrales bacterium]|nr:hypothetical protein [Candidatus Limnocylindrales bacterium]